MAISAPVSLASATDNVDRTTYTTASFTPTANRLVLFAVLNQVTTAPTGTPTVTGNGLTYVQLSQVGYNSVVTPKDNLTVFGAIGASPSAGAATIDFAGATQIGCQWSVCEIPGTETSSAQAAVAQRVATGAAAATTLALTLGGIRNGTSLVYGAFGHLANEATVQGTGFTLIHSTSHNNPVNGLGTEYLLTPQTTVDASWTTSATNGGIALEIRPPMDTQWEGVPI